FQEFYEKNLRVMPTNLSKRHGINAIFVLALDKALEEEKLDHEQFKEHILAIYQMMTQSIIDAQIKRLEESEDPWRTFVEDAKKGNTLLYDNKYFEGIVAYDVEGCFGIDIQECLYFEILSKNKRPDLGPILCAYDSLLANAIERWFTFERNRTIADGWSYCDFRYYSKESPRKQEIEEEKKKLFPIVLDFVHKETGWGNPLKPQCEYDDLFLRGILNIDANKILVRFTYQFDEDGFSMYDKNHILKGELILDSERKILSFKLEETYTGPGCVEDPYKTKL
ncbi:MAG TPA: L-2-amino-thiazoline-4-carboxylic acid hydrolase, partial [Candidatus Bathyarchaeia archaeon]|nr:L-2-amino-thiazoline-4-carboxylic acid hydrolase [Candidatus Bathyarchaeia archaeon]